ncbi:hypothetical protein BH10ACI2_BH10ACI2_04060 [soil metagenome]
MWVLSADLNMWCSIGFVFSVSLLCVLCDKKTSNHRDHKGKTQSLKRKLIDIRATPQTRTPPETVIDVRDGIFMRKNWAFSSIVIFSAVFGLLPLIAAGQGNYFGKTDRPLRYTPDRTDFVIENGNEFFNRPLYGGNTAFRLDAGDKPEFVLYLPGRGGNLRFGIKSAAGAKWLHDAARITTRYRPGSMIYEVRDPLLGNGVLKLEVLATYDTEGAIVRFALQNAANVDLFWVYGGVNGERGRRDGDIGTEKVPVSEFFQFKPEFAKDNKFEIIGNNFSLESKIAKIHGIMPPGAKLIIADAAAWNDLPKLIAGSVNTTESPVIVGRLPLVSGKLNYIALQRGILPKKATETKLNETQQDLQDPARDLAASYKTDDLPRIFDAAEKYREALASKIVVDTPDPYINAAGTALSVAGDSVWDDQQSSFMHGAVAWRTKLLGWRGPYLGDTLGWHDRMRRHLEYWSTRQNTSPIAEGPPKQDASVNFARNEPELHTNGDVSNSHYDMNVVYIDAIFRHILWTGDVEFARKMFPLIERHLAWERRLFRREFGPDKLPLYEAYVVIWASDDLQYNGGGVTHSTAYNYYHNKMAGRIARLIGADPTQYEREADLIQKAMRQNLWLGDAGWYGEYKDLLGLQKVHENAALWTFYNTVDSEAVTPLEAWQMSRFVDTQVPHIPIRGEGIPKGDFYTLSTTSWMPYTWSTNNVVVAEAMHTSLALWQAGRGDDALKLFKGVLLDSMYSGLCPGNAGMATKFDMARGESQRDFADGIAMSSRALIEGVFGVKPDALAGELNIHPGFPSDWDHASLHHADLDLSFRRTGLRETYSVVSRFQHEMKLRLSVPALRDRVASVTVNGIPANWHVLESAVGAPRVEIITPNALTKYDVVITWKGDTPASAATSTIAARNQKITIDAGSAKLLGIEDPQKVLGNVTMNSSSAFATVTGADGHRTVFAKVGQGDLTWWKPFDIEVRNPFEIATVEDQTADSLSFRIRNNTANLYSGEVKINIGGRNLTYTIKIPSMGESDVIRIAATDEPPGSNPVAIDLGNGRTANGVIVNWKLKKELRTVENVDLSPYFNDRVTNIFEHEYLSPRSPFVSLAMPKQGIGSWVHWDEQFDVDDSGIRKASARNGGKLNFLTDIAFLTPANEKEDNIAFASQWDNFPREINVPLSGAASHLYLLMAGSTNQMQSRMDNGEVIVTYTDGSNERLALNNPINWWPIDQDYFIDDYAFRRPEPIPPRVDLRPGTVRFPDPRQTKGGKIPGGSATVLDMPLDTRKEVKSLTVRALANEVLIGLMSATLVR